MKKSRIQNSEFKRATRLLRSGFCLLVFLLALTVPGNAQEVRRRVEGHQFSSSASQYTQALNTATTYQAFSYPKIGTSYFTSFEIRVSAVTGTLTNISLEVQADASGVPSNTALETVTVTSSLPTGATNFTFTGAGTTSLTDGAIYWYVLKNNTPTPASNYYSVQYMTGHVSSALVSSGATNGYAKAVSTDGTNWTLGVGGITGTIVGYSDASYDGLASVNALATSDKAYGTHEAGIQWTTPANVKYNVAGVGIYVRKGSSPTGNLTAKLYTGGGGATPPTFKATSSTAYAPATVSAAGQVLAFFFSSPQSIDPSTVVTFTLKDTAADDSSNYYYLMGMSMYDTGATSLSLLPGQGTAVAIGYDGASWSTSTSVIPKVTLILDATTPYLARATSKLVISEAATISGGVTLQ